MAPNNDNTTQNRKQYINHYFALQKSSRGKNHLGRLFNELLYPKTKRFLSGLESPWS